MRWRRLFDDLEAQFDAAEAAELAAEVSDRTRREMSLLRTVDRLAGSRGRALTFTVQGAGAVKGTLLAAAPEWLLLEEPPAREVLVRAGAVLAVSGLGPRSGVPGAEGEVGRRLGLASALRGLSRDRTPVTVDLVDGARLSGTIDRVGQDYLELAEHHAGEPRRPAAVSGVRLLPFAALALLRAAG